MAFKSFQQLTHMPLIVDLTVEENARCEFRYIFFVEMLVVAAWSMMWVVEKLKGAIKSKKSYFHDTNCKLSFSVIVHDSWQLWQSI